MIFVSAQIKVYSGDMRALGSTSKAFNVTKTEELMREYTLDFSVTNNDSIFKYITENSVFEFGGQKFDISGIDGNSGSTNITQITAEHISYRLADYTLPNGYSFVGTVRQIAEDILREAKTVDEIPAISAFSIGSTADLGTLNFSMSGATNVTARQALIAMSDLGVEIEFDNFTVNLPQSRGSDKGVVFRYSQNLNGVHRTWQRGNGWSYEISIVDLQKTPGYEGETYGLGDYITVEDMLMNLTLKKRIISYKECDDPTQNSVTVGVFVRDNASLSIETDRIANTANTTANTANATANAANTTASNSVQQGERYSNVSITHTDGFKAVSKDGTLRVMMNGDDCFIVQGLQNGKWVTLNQLEAFGLLIDRLTSIAAKDRFYVQVGRVDGGNYGLKFYFNNTEGCSISSANQDEVTISVPNSITIVAENTNGNVGLKGDTVSFESKGIYVHDKDANTAKYGITGKMRIGILNEGGGETYGQVEFINGIVTGFLGL